jgi:CheY-like chemotaxis protein
MKLRRILLVEDNDKDLELTLAALEQHNLVNSVDVARDGAEALEFLTNKPADELPVVVLLDLKLPKIDGLEVLRRIRSAPATRHLPVAILTSSREESDLVRGYELGVNAFVVKPVDFQQFIATVRDLGFFWAVLNEPPPHIGV